MKNKNILSFVIFTLFLFLTNLAVAQSEIYGTWAGHCAMEKSSISSICTCGICPMFRVDSSSVNFLNIDIILTDKTIKIGNNDSVNYKWDNNLFSITFPYKKATKHLKFW